MKQLLKTLILTILCLPFIGCSNDDDDARATIKILKSDVSYSALGGIGEIVVETADAITATVTADWCAINVVDKVVTLKVAAHESITTRSTYVTIKSGDESILVGISQAGVISYIGIPLSKLQFSLSGETQHFPIRLEAPAVVSIDVSWLTYEVKEGRIYFTASPAEVNRLANIVVNYTYDEGEKVQRFTIHQDKYDYQHYLGEWTMTYGESLTRKIKIEPKIERQTYAVVDLFGFPAEFAYNSIENIMEVFMHDLDGQVEGNSLRLYMWDSTAGLLSLDAAVGGKFIQDTSFDGTRFKMQDNGVWGTSVARGFYVRRLNAAGASVGVYGSVRGDIYLTR